MGGPNKIITYDAILFGATVALFSAAGLHYYKKWKKQTAAAKKEWRRVGIVSDIFIYPLKSGHRIQLETGFCAKEGLQMAFGIRDRSFIIYDPTKNQFRTARDYPKLINVKLSPYDANTVSLSTPVKDVIYFELSRISKESKFITMHKEEKISIRDCGEEVAQYISSYILEKDTGLRLGFYNSERKRDVTKTHMEHLEQYKNFSNDATGLQSDFSSYLIINQASVDDVASKIKTDKISVLNFRPNIVVKPDSKVPYAEDKWDNIKIGDVEFYYVKPCTRCVFTTIDPARAEKSVDNEPLKTLRTYRTLDTILKDAKIERSLTVMGVNVGLNVEGPIEVGTPVYVTLL